MVKEALVTASHPRGSPRGPLSSLAARLSHADERSAIDEGEAAAEGLVRRSGAVHVAFVMLLSFVAFAGSAPGISSALFEGSAVVWVGLVVVGAATTLIPSSLGALLGLAFLAVGGGALLAILDHELLPGLATTFALSVTLAEVIALVLVLAARSALSPPISLAAAAATTGALAYLLDGGLAPSTPLGVGAGGALAIAFVLHARYAEGAVTLRHASHHVIQAARTRWVEGLRGVTLLLHG